MISHSECNSCGTGMTLEETFAGNYCHRCMYEINQELYDIVLGWFRWANNASAGQDQEELIRRTNKAIEDRLRF